MSITSSASGAEEVLDRIRAVLALGVRTWVCADLYRCEIDSLLRVPSPPYPSQVVAIAPGRDLERFEAAHPDSGGDRYGDHRADRVFAVVRNERAVAWTRIGATDACVRLEHGEVLVQGVWVEPAARVTGLGAALVAAALQAMGDDRSATAAACAVCPTDDHMRRILVELGFEQRGSTRVLRPLAGIR